MPAKRNEKGERGGKRFIDRINVDREREQVKIAVREELERFFLKANLHDSLWMIIPNESFEAKEKRIVAIAFSQKRVKSFHASPLLVCTYLNDFQSSCKMERVNYILSWNVCVDIKYARARA